VGQSFTHRRDDFKELAPHQRFDSDLAMNIILLRKDDWIDDHVALVRDHRAEHIRSVLKADVGDLIRVGLLGGSCGHAVIESLDPDGVSLSVKLSEAPPPRHRFDIILALPRPKMLRRILRQCAEFGVANLHLINSARVEKSYWQSPLLRPERIQEALLTGLERSRDTLAPQIHLHKRFRPFVEDQLKELCAGRAPYCAPKGSKKPYSQAWRDRGTLLLRRFIYTNAFAHSLKIS